MEGIKNLVEMLVQIITYCSYFSLMKKFLSFIKKIIHKRSTGIC